MKPRPILQSGAMILWMAALMADGLAAPLGSPSGLRTAAASISTVWAARTLMTCMKDTWAVDAFVNGRGNCDDCSALLGMGRLIYWKGKRAEATSCQALGRDPGGGCAYKICAPFTTPGPSSAAVPRVPLKAEAPGATSPWSRRNTDILGNDDVLGRNAPSAVGAPSSTGGRTGGSQNLR